MGQIEMYLIMVHVTHANRETPAMSATIAMMMMMVIVVVVVGGGRTISNSIRRLVVDESRELIVIFH